MMGYRHYVSSSRIRFQTEAKSWKLALKSLAAGAVVISAVCSGSAEAAMVITIEAVGDDVFVSGAGTINTTSFTSKIDISNLNAGLAAQSATLSVGTNINGTPTPADVHFGAIAGPNSFGPGTASTTYISYDGTGDKFGIYDSGKSDGTLEMIVPDEYVSGSSLTGTNTYSNQSFDSMGITVGTYVWSWGSGENADTLTLNVIPEPSSLALLGLGGLLVARRRRAA